MSSVYGRLGFNSSDPTTSSTVSNYSSNVIVQMSMVPTLLQPWQVSALGSGTVSGFFQNPVANVTDQVWNTSNTLVSISNNLTSTVSSTITSLLANVHSTSIVLSTITANNYLYVTNKESNVIPPDSNNTTPHYQTAIAQGKALSYLVNQTDGVQNNSVIMGNFTSITLGNTLNSLYSTMSTYTQILQASTTVVGNLIIGFSNTTTISLSSAQTLQNTVYQIYNLMTVYPAQDSQFFQNSANVLSDFTNISQFNNLGQSQTYLLNNYIGTPTLVSNLNS